MNAWEVLGLEHDADESAVKRAYARCVRKARPEDDIAAFQRFTDAYHWLLHDMRARRGATARDADAAPTPAAVNHDAPMAPRSAAVPGDGEKPVPVATPTGAGFEFAPFFDEVAQRVRLRDPRPLRQWLQDHPDLYPLDLKWALMPHVFDALARDAHALDPLQAHVDVLMAFFGIDARLRQHPSLAPAIDYLESARWRQSSPSAKAGTPMPKGWENLDQLMGGTDGNASNPRPRPRTDNSNSGLWVIWLLIGLMTLGRLLAGALG